MLVSIFLTSKIKSLFHINLQSVSVIFKYKLNLRAKKFYSTIENYNPNNAKNRVEFKNILFLGSDNFSLCSLKMLMSIFPSPSTQITVIVSNENNLVGKFSKFHSVPYLLWDDFKKALSNNNDESQNRNIHNSFQFDIGVVASFGHLIPNKIIKTCERGILNVHGSILPKYRGAAPIAHAIINGDTSTGVSIMKIAPKRFDIGPILHRRCCPISQHVLAPELTETLAQLGSQILKEVLLDFSKFSVEALPQDNSASSNAPKLVNEMSEVNWTKNNGVEIYNLYRGLYGTFKLKTLYHNKIVNLDDLCIFSNEPKSAHEINIKVPDSSEILKFEPGEILFKDGVLCVKCFCKNGESEEDIRKNWIFVRKIKIGTKWMSAKDFSNGFLSKSKNRHFFESILHTANASTTVDKIDTQVNNVKSNKL